MPNDNVSDYEKNIADLEIRMAAFNNYADTKDSIDMLLDKLSVNNLTTTKPFAAAIPVNLDHHQAEKDFSVVYQLSRLVEIHEIENPPAPIEQNLKTYLKEEDKVDLKSPLSMSIMSEMKQIFGEKEKSNSRSLNSHSENSISSNKSFVKNLKASNHQSEETLSAFENDRDVSSYNGSSNSLLEPLETKVAELATKHSSNTLEIEKNSLTNSIQNVIVSIIETKSIESKTKNALPMSVIGSNQPEKSKTPTPPISNEILNVNNNEIEVSIQKLAEATIPAPIAPIGVALEYALNSNDRYSSIGVLAPDDDYVYDEFEEEEAEEENDTAQTEEFVEEEVESEEMPTGVFSEEEVEELQEDQHSSDYDAENAETSKKRSYEDLNHNENTEKDYANESFSGEEINNGDINTSSDQSSQAQIDKIPIDEKPDFIVHEVNRESLVSLESPVNEFSIYTTTATTSFSQQKVESKKKTCTKNDVLLPSAESVEKERPAWRPASTNGGAYVQAKPLDRSLYAVSPRTRALSNKKSTSPSEIETRPPFSGAGGRKIHEIQPKKKEPEEKSRAIGLEKVVQFVPPTPKMPMETVIPSPRVLKYYSHSGKGLTGNVSSCQTQILKPTPFEYLEWCEAVILQATNNGDKEAELKARLDQLQALTDVNETCLTVDHVSALLKLSNYWMLTKNASEALKVAVKAKSTTVAMIQEESQKVVKSSTTNSRAIPESEEEKLLQATTPQKTKNMREVILKMNTVGVLSEKMTLSIKLEAIVDKLLTEIIKIRISSHK